MLKPNELQKLGETLSSDFLERGVPLTEGLDKIASSSGLNKNQINRVAEIANVKTHLSLLKEASAEDAYIKFDVADPLKVKAVERPKIAHSLSDYDYPPQREHFYDTESVFKLAGYVPQKEEERKDPSQDFKNSINIREKVARLQNSVLEGSIRLENKMTPIYKLVKQAALGGVSTDSLSFILKEAAPLGEYLIDYLSPQLSKDGITLQKEGFEKFAGKKLNTDNELFNLVIDFNDSAVELIKEAEELVEEKEKLGSHQVEKLGKSEEINFGTKLAGVIS